MSIKVSLPDGSIKEFDSQVTALQVAESISMGLARNAVCAEIDGVPCQLDQVIDHDVAFKVFTLKVTFLFLEYPSIIWFLIFSPYWFVNFSIKNSGKFIISPY